VPICPSEPCMTEIKSTSLNGGFAAKDLAMYGADGITRNLYYLALRRISGTGAPQIRVACTTSVRELFFSTETGKSLSDLGVITNAISVGAVDLDDSPICTDVLDPLGDSSGDCSSRGPTSLAGGPVKPDLVGPGNVTNFTVWDYATSFYGNFVGSSAAAAHVAGLVALLQSQSLQQTGAMLSPQTVRSMLIRAAIPLALVPGEEFQFGAGLAHIPDPAPGPYRMTAMTPCRMFDSRTMPGPSGGAPQKLQGGIERVIKAGGTCGVPPGAKAVAGILTVVGPSSPGFISLFAGDALRPLSAAMTFSVGQVISNNAMVKVADNGTGTIRAFLDSGTADFVFDVTGYFQ